MFLVYAIATLAVIFWGGTPVATKIAATTIDPATIGVLRAIIAGPAAIFLVIALKLRLPTDQRGFMLLIVSGATSFAIWPSLLSYGIGLTTATHAGLILALIPIVTGLLASAIDRTQPGLSWWAGSTVAVIGTAILVLSGSDDNAGGPSLAGDLIIFSGVVTCAIGYIAGAKITPQIGTWSTTFWGISLAAALLVPIAVIMLHRTDWTMVDSRSWLSLFYLALFGTIGGYVGWYWALGHGGVTRISTWQLAQPVVTLGLAALILGESLTIALLLVAAAIVAGAAYAQRPARRQAAERADTD